MPSKKQWLILITLSLLLLTLLSCATYEGYDRMCASWLDHDADDLMRQWGPPHREKKLSNGNTLLYYDSSQTTFLVGSKGGVAIPVTKRCKTWFEVTPKGHILTYRWKGKRCKAKYP